MLALPTKKICNTLHALISYKMNKSVALLLAIIIFGAFLRLYDFEHLARFNADQVRDATIVTQMHENNDFPLLGPKAGGTKFKLGPAFYYIEYISGQIFGFSPWGIAFFIPLFSIVSIGLFYILFKKIFSQNITLLITLLYASSFYDIKYSRFAWNPNVIPFFILAFILLLISIINKKSTLYTYILLGIVVGIGIQLHTTLLILMPTVLLCVLIFTMIKEKIIAYKEILTIILIILAMNLPFIYSDYLSHGSNIKEFAAGIQKKTDSDVSLVTNIATTSQFFLQGNTYALLGIEPQKNWTRVSKFMHSRDMSEYILFIISIILGMCGLWLFRKKFTTTDPLQKNILTLLIFFFSISFVLFLAIGTELNTRFFIVLIFLPYLLLGTIFEYITRTFTTSITSILIGCITTIIVMSNVLIIYHAYNLENYTLRESVYGGISLGEINTVCTTIQATQEKIKPSQKKFFIDDVEYKRSISYVCAKNNMSLTDFHVDKTPSNSTVFMLVRERENVEQNELTTKNLTIITSKKIGRFHLLTLLFTQV